jgi:hypothetical protein
MEAEQRAVTDSGPVENTEYLNTMCRSSMTNSWKLRPGRSGSLRTIQNLGRANNMRCSFPTTACGIKGAPDTLLFDTTQQYPPFRVINKKAAQPTQHSCSHLGA